MEAFQSEITPEMHQILLNAAINPPKTHEEQYKYAHATLTRFIVKEPEYFAHFFYDKNDFIKFAEWFAKKETEPFTEQEMTGIKVLNTCQIKYFAMAIFKETTIGIFDENQFYHYSGVPKNAQKQRQPRQQIPTN